MTGINLPTYAEAQKADDATTNIKPVKTSCSCNYQVSPSTKKIILVAAVVATWIFVFHTAYTCLGVGTEGKGLSYFRKADTDLLVPKTDYCM